MTEQAATGRRQGWWVVLDALKPASRAGWLLRIAVVAWTGGQAALVGPVWVAVVAASLVAAYFVVLQ